MKRILGDDRRRLRSKVAVDESGCWVWQGWLDPDGYGQMKLDGRTQAAHRASYMLEVGPIPDGAHVDHLCKNTACVNPEHLEPVTPRENWRRSDSPSRVNAEKTHCANGHPYDTTNTYRADGRRHCRACNREAARRYAQKQRRGVSA